MKEERFEKVVEGGESCWVFLIGFFLSIFNFAHLISLNNNLNLVGSSLIVINGLMVFFSLGAFLALLSERKVHWRKIE